MPRIYSLSIPNKLLWAYIYIFARRLQRSNHITARMLRPWIFITSVPTRTWSKKSKRQTLFPIPEWFLWVMQYWCKALIFCNWEGWMWAGRSTELLFLLGCMCFLTEKCTMLVKNKPRPDWAPRAGASLTLFYKNIDMDSLRLAWATRRSGRNSCRQTAWWNENLLQRKEKDSCSRGKN